MGDMRGKQGTYRNTCENDEANLGNVWKKMDMDTGKMTRNMGKMMGIFITERDPIIQGVCG